jgi:hypothetical protein
MSRSSRTPLQPDEAGVAAPATGNWGQVTYKPGIVGDNATNKYSVEPYWVDANRQHAVYGRGG